MDVRDCRSAWEHMSEISKLKQHRNFVQLLDMSNYVVETELFPSEALEAYSAINMEQQVSADQIQYVSSQRGGPQGDYREGMQKKIANLVDCLSNFPQSKRAVLTISNQPSADHRNDADAKCLRELHLYIDDNSKLSCTVLFRAQAASIFPKNIHLIGSIMTEVAKQLPAKPKLGTAFYLATVLAADRS